ncbi:MAG: hypothetical protein D6794_06155 [Deltaproteobacteria bacterium]|nr:MAG: hypothetical protein D6794_06155 [Deltaproteobacteria bacterium]
MDEDKLTGQQKPISFGDAEQSDASPQQEQQDAPLTTAQVQAMIEEAMQKTLEQSRRMAQSLTDKADTRLQKLVQSRIAQLEEAWKMQAELGMPVPDDEQKEAARQKVAQSVMEAAGDGGAQDDAALPQDDGKGTNDNETAAIVNRRAQAIYEKYGIDLNEDDPEAELIDQSSPGAFLVSLEEALVRKKKRVSGARAANLGGNGKPAAQVQPGSGFDLLQQYYRKGG